MEELSFETQRENLGLDINKRWLGRVAAKEIC